MIVTPSLNDPRVKPPLDAQINRGHPLARDLRGCWLFQAGDGLKDYTGRGHGLSLTSLPGVTGGYTKYTGYGDSQGLSCYGGDNYSYAQASESTELRIADSVTLIWRGVLFGAQGGNAVLAGMPYATTNIAPFHAYSLIRPTGNQVVWAFWNQAGTGRLLSQAISFYVPLGLAFTVTNGAAKLYLNGQIAQSSTDASTLNYSGSPLFSINHQHVDETSGSNALHSAAWVYQRVLSPAEILWQFQEPYVMFQPTVQRSWLNTYNPATAAPTARSFAVIVG